ncbi:hypothetical protein LMG26411_06624 [Cupriavidus numazuensis]|uniref:Lipoprotein n=1 Tax=Cupriavidus numazuensis TaxID=221992 RepID=A0ABM8TSX8_9BURK|nr:hypothetical protein LMG26411_06624 [Cupriavidus numazuensis]
MYRICRQLPAVIALLATGCVSFSQKPFLERLQWGSAPEALGPHVEINRDEWMTKRIGRCYRRLNDGSIVDGVQSRDTEYCFNRGALYSVRTHFDGEDLRGKWQQWLTEIYGRPQTDSWKQLGWNPKEIWVSLRYVTTSYSGPEDTGTVTWTHRRYMPPSSASACEAFDSGFRDCMERERVRIQAIDAR